MNLNLKMMYTLMGLAFIFTSCVESDKDLSKTTKPTITADLTVPEDFDWAMTRNVALSTKSPKETSASIYLDETCTDLVATLPISEGDGTIVLDLPSANDAIWLKHLLTDGKEVINKVSIKKTTTTRSGAAGWTASQIFPDRTSDMSGNDVGGSVYQPAKDKFGTIMFEDMWPDKGDYDFNDFVANYNVAASLKWGEPYLYITVKLKIRAMGGSLPYRLCMQLGAKEPRPAVSREDIEIIEANTEISNFPQGGVELLDAKRPIFAIKGCNELRPTDGHFFNTQKDHLISANETPTISFTFKLAIGNEYGPNLLNAFASQFAFDYFLQNPKNMREIHLIDYPPTELYTTYEQDSKGQMGKEAYCNDHRFVWALKAPVEMAWPVEKQDILGVYPEFGEWIIRGGDYLESNGYDERLWYIDNRLTKDTSKYINPKEH